jgi:hypothetical protein
MKPPTPEEVEAYAKTIDFKINGEVFCDYYEVGGWVYGKNKIPIKSWKACVRTWKRYNKERAAQNGQPPILE